MKLGGTAVILYAPPAAGKDTVTTALGSADPRFRLYRRMKVGDGRTAGYRMATADALAELEAARNVIYSNRRYNATYVVDRPELANMLAAADIPVLHVGQPEAVAALLSAEPNIRWVVVELWCPRDVAAARIEARATGDTQARIEAWDATPRLAIADLRIDTSEIAPHTAAQLIAEAVRVSACTIVVPAMHLIHADGSLDLAATRQYAKKAGSGWADYILLNGSTTAGDELAPDERVAVLDAWLDAIDPALLLACAWSPSDLDAAIGRHVTPMAVLKATNTDAAEQILRDLPPGSTIYSHSEFGATFTPELASWARATGCLPAGGKLAKARLEDISAIRQAAPDFAVWDGSSRHLRQSAESGAAGVVATPLAAILTNLPARSVEHIQAAVDAVYAELDQLSDRAAKRAWLLSRITGE